MKRSFIFFMWACRLRRRSPAPSPQPVVVWPQSCKRSFLRSLFCSSVHIASRLCGLSTYALMHRMAKVLSFYNLPQCFQKLRFIFQSDTGYGIKLTHPIVHLGEGGIFDFGGLLRFSLFFQIFGSGRFQLYE